MDPFGMDAFDASGRQAANAKGLGFSTPTIEAPKNDLLEFKSFKHKSKPDVLTQVDQPNAPIGLTQQTLHHYSENQS
jgi:hypothetical protein